MELSPAAGRLLATVGQSPPSTLSDTRDRTESERYAFDAALGELVEAGLVHRIQQGQHTLLVPHRPATEECLDQVKAPWNPHVRRLHDFLATHELCPRKLPLTALAAMLSLLVSGCLGSQPCYDIYSVGRVPAHVDTHGWTVVDLDQEEDLSRFGHLIDMLEAARGTQGYEDVPHNYTPDTRTERREWDRILEHLDKLSLKQNNATAWNMQYRGELYMMSAIHADGCVW